MPGTVKASKLCRSSIWPRSKEGITAEVLFLGTGHWENEQLPYNPFELN
jgi:hypothetical protein